MKSNTNPYIVWALFDDDNRSYYKALNDLPDVRVISIGIKNNDGPDYFKCYTTSERRWVRCIKTNEVSMCYR